MIIQLTSTKSSNIVVLISALLFLVFDTFVLGISYWIANEVESDALTINIAGRQRMLSQRMTKSLLQMQIGIQNNNSIDPHLLRELQLSSSFFHSTLQAFSKGGNVIAADERKLFQQAINDTKGAQLVQQTISIWQPMHRSIQNLFEGSPAIAHQEIQGAVEMSIQVNSQLLKLSNEITNHVEMLSSEKTQNLRTLQILAFCLALINFSVLLGSIWKRMSSLTSDHKILKKQANVDELTGLANRRHLEDYLKKQISRCSRSRQIISVILFDIDHFKAFNDTMGHVEGDQCLSQFGALLKASIHRPSDLAARYGGEEFCLVLPETELAGAKEIAETIRSGLLALRIPHPSSTTSNLVTISAGVACFTPSIQSRSKEILKLADIALYEAKGAGRNQVQIYQS